MIKAVYDCLSCGACCQNISLFGEFKQMTSVAEIRRELKIDGEWRDGKLVESLLVFSGERAEGGQPIFRCRARNSNGCSIYSKRPYMCREFEKGCEACVEIRKREGLLR